MPSLHEGLALLPIEAAMAKVPTIINDCPGLSETLPPDWPLKVNGNNLTQYLTIFSNLDSFNRDDLGKSAFLFANNRFQLKTMQTNYERFYSLKLQNQK